LLAGHIDALRDSFRTVRRARVTPISHIHFNPVKHGWVRRAADWPHSSIHRLIREGRIDPSWASVGDMDINAGE